MKPVVAIVGRANVGKSTLFNRLAAKPVAIVEGISGTTRDRVFADVQCGGREIILIDTGGLEIKPDSSLAQKIKQQVGLAISEADVIIFLVDVRDGVIAADQEIAGLLRSSQKPVILAANKVDNLKLESQVADFYQLGFGTPLAISAYHARGMNNLVRDVTSHLPQPSLIPTKTRGAKLAIVGRPNVGKSMLLNAILGEDRAIVDDVPGTTRDALDTILHYGGHEILLIDTAGIRRRTRVDTNVEYYSSIRALRAVNRADIALLVIDASELITAQDMRIASYIREVFKGVVLVVNKWDLIPRERREMYAQQIKQQLNFMPYVPIVYASAKFGQGINEIIPQALRIFQERQKQLSDPVVDTFIKGAAAAHKPPQVGSRRLKIFHVHQAEVDPPTFVFSVNDPHLVSTPYERYLENRLRQIFGFYGTALRFIFTKTPARTSGERGDKI